jgi:hypothetical protein
MVGSNVSFNYSFVYGDNCSSKWEALWFEIVNYSISWETIPWILLGDFNAIRSHDEKCGGTMSWSGWQNDLNNYVLKSCLEDLRVIGSRFTWTNQQSNNTLLKKLDQVLDSLGPIDKVTILSWRSWIRFLLMSNGIANLQVWKLAFYLWYLRSLSYVS